VGRATIFGQDSAIGPTERHFHSELGILPILVRLLSLAEPKEPKCAFPETRAERTLLQIVVQSQKNDVKKAMTVNQAVKPA
jgi:hypothetical protein